MKRYRPKTNPNDVVSLTDEEARHLVPDVYEEIEDEEDDQQQKAEPRQKRKYKRRDMRAEN